MKTKFITKISSFLLVFVLCIMALVGCTTAELELPSNTAPVVGNGGLAVQKGEYLYFVNGYESIDNLKSGDNKSGEKYSAIYRTKLNANNELTFDADGNLENCELIIDKICGFEKTALYIFDDYIYYATPNTEKEVSDEVISSNFELTDFYKAKLDGTGRSHIYKTTKASDDTKFAFYKANGQNDVYLALYDGTQLLLVNCKSKAVTTVCDSISSIAMPTVTTYNSENNQISVGASNIYYTRNAKEDETVSSGNLLCAVRIGDNQERILAQGTYTYTVKSATEEALVFTKKSDSDLNANNYAISYAYNDGGDVVLDVQNQGVQLDATAHDTVLLCTYEEGNFVGMVTKNSSNKLVYINRVTNVTEVLDEDTTLTPIAIAGNYVYAYDSDNSIYQINYKTKAQKLLADTSKTGDDAIKSPYLSAKKNFSVCGNYIYYFATYQGEKTGYYLNRVTTISQEDYIPELVGVLQAEHLEVEE